MEPSGRLYWMALCSRFVTHLAQLVGIGGQRCGAIAVDVQAQAVRLGQGAHHRGTLLGQGGGVDLLRPQPVHTGVEAGQRQQAVHGLVHLQRADAAVLDQLAVFVRRARLAQGDLDRGQQGGQRRAQLVRDVGGGLLLALEGAAELLQRLREAVGDRPQLDRHLLRVERQLEVAAGNLTDRVGQPPQRQQADPDQYEGADDGGGEGRGSDQQQAVAQRGQRGVGLTAHGDQFLVPTGGELRCLGEQASFVEGALDVHGKEWRFSRGRTPVRARRAAAARGPWVRRPEDCAAAAGRDETKAVPVAFSGSRGAPPSPAPTRRH